MNANKVMEDENSWSNGMYLFFDIGHDNTKVGQFKKSIKANFEYFMVPT